MTNAHLVAGAPRREGVARRQLDAPLLGGRGQLAGQREHDAFLDQAELLDPVVPQLANTRDARLHDVLGVEAPAVRPTLPVSHSGRMSAADSISQAREPSPAATSTRRFALLLAGAPTTSTVGQRGAMYRTACCRLVVA